MLLALFGGAVASILGLALEAVAAVLPANVWDGIESLMTPLAFLVPPTFAATIPVVLAAFLSTAGVRIIMRKFA